MAGRRARTSDMSRRLRLAVTVLCPTTIVGQSVSRPIPDTLRMQLLWEVAPGTAAVADSLGELSSVAVDGFGNVYVSDFSAFKIWVFDKKGRSLPGIGRKGQGPGEFSAPTGLGIGPDGRLYVRDIDRVSRFSLDPATNRLTRYESSFRNRAMSDWRSMRPSRFDSAGRMYYPGFDKNDRTRTTGHFFRYSIRGELLDSVMVPGFPDAPKYSAWFRNNPGGGPMLRGLSYPPFFPLPVWDMTPRGTIITGAAKTYLLEERDAQGTLRRTYRRELAADRIPARERAESLSALKARLDSVPVPLDRVEDMPAAVRRRQLPDVFPAYMAAYSTDDNLLWVRRWPVGDTRRTIFDVFNSDGRYTATIILPRAIAVAPPPVLSLDRIVAIGIDPETGANLILSFGRAARS